MVHWYYSGAAGQARSCNALIWYDIALGEPKTTKRKGQEMFAIHRNDGIDMLRLHERYTGSPPTLTMFVDVSFNVNAEPTLPAGDSVTSLIRLRRMKMWHVRGDGDNGNYSTFEFASNELSEITYLQLPFYE